MLAGYWGTAMTATCFAMTLLMLGAKPNTAPELLPKTPPDWRFERIEFPLPFAPDLKYEGFEELRFAPGMFSAQSDTYFTYIFAMKLKNKADLDAPALKSLLETYFRGLCKAVAEGTDFKIDGSKISARVREDHFEAQYARHFNVTLESFDPFVTGKPLTLHLEILTLKLGPADQRLFAAVSPKPVDAPIWKLLRTLKTQFHKLNTTSDK